MEKEICLVGKKYLTAFLYYRIILENLEIMNVL